MARVLTQVRSLRTHNSKVELRLADVGQRFTPSPETVIPISEANHPLVGKDMRLFTREGCPRIGDILGVTVEAWSGNPSGGWVRVTPRAAGEVVDMYRVRLDDGRCLTCAANHPWPVVSGRGRIVPVLTKHLRTDLAVSPFVQFSVEDLGGVSCPRAYEMGIHFGRKFTQKARNKDGLPLHLFELDPRSLADFVAGWLDSQKGILFGGKEAIHDLQILLHRLGVYHTFCENRGRFGALVLSEKDAENIPNPRGRPRDYRRITSNMPRIVEVCLLNEKRRAYTLDVEEGHTVVVDGIISLC